MPTKHFTDKQGRQIRLVYNGGATIEAFDGNECIGHISWHEACTGSHKYGGETNAALLTHIYLDKIAGYTGCGIGTEIVRMITEWTGYPVLVCRDNGTTRDDGAHPTGDAPGFYRALVAKGLASWIG